MAGEADSQCGYEAARLVAGSGVMKGSLTDSYSIASILSLAYSACVSVFEAFSVT